MTPPTDDIPQRESPFQSNIVMLFGVLLFLAGAILNVEMYLTDSRPTSIFFALMVIGLVVFFLGLWSKRSWITRGKPRGFFKRNIAFFVLPTVLIFFLAYQVGTGVQTVVEEKMTWTYGIPTEDTSRTHIIFQFANYPDYLIGVYSSDLSEKLKALGQDTVDVRIIVTTDFGVMRAFQVVQIGPITEWDGVVSYSVGASGVNTPPWMQ